MNYPKPCLHLVMPGPPPKGLNSSDGLARQGVKAKCAVKREWDDRVLAAWAAAGRPRIAEPLATVWVRLFSGRGRPMDQRNLQASAKVPEDALVRRGVLVDDRPAEVVQSIALQRRVERGREALVVLGFPAPNGHAQALRTLAEWVALVWEDEHAWPAVLGEASEPFAEGWFYPRTGASPAEWAHGTSWRDAQKLHAHRNPHLEVVHQVTDGQRDWKQQGLVDDHLRAIRQELARSEVLVSSFSYRVVRVRHAEQRGVALRLHAPTPLAKATA